MKKMAILKIILGLSILPITAFAHESFDCSGTEPFWSVSLTSNSFIFKRESDVINLTPVKPQKMGSTLIYNTHSMADNLPVTIHIKHTTCSNGMSDQTFNYHVTYKTGNQTFEGCCETQSGKSYKNNSTKE